MKKLLILTVSALLVFAFAFTAYAETKITVTGQLRSRGEGTQKSFDAANEHIGTIGYLRTRININAEVAENASAFVQLQDSRMYGVAGQSGSLNNDTNVGVHQAFIKYNLWTKENWSIGVLAGRFEFNWGNQRLLGAVGWSNVGRSWEGELAWYDAKKFSITLGVLKIAEKSKAGYDGDFDAYVLAASIKDIGLDLLAFTEDNKDTSFATVQPLKRTTLAAYYKRRMEQVDVEFNVAAQTGTIANSDSTELDISAMLFAGEIGYSFEGERNARLAIAIDYASGNDGSDPTKFKRFNNLYWTGHKFNGYMDYFTGAGSNVSPNGLVDMIFRGKIDITNGWTLGADVHIFSAAQEYSFIDYSTATPTNITTKDIGSEVDFTVKTKRVKGIALQWGVSVFTAKDNFSLYKEMPIFDITPGAKQFSSQSGTWVYSQATMNF